MQLHEVSEIKELFVVDQINEALTDGWKIVAVVASVLPGAVTGDGPVACYVMTARVVDCAKTNRASRY